jgi:hypothetical protein
MISVLGTADYGTLTIHKAISIVNGGGFEAGIMVPSNAFGIEINAGPNDSVSLRGLTIEGGGVASTGIQFNSGKSLTVDNCLIRRIGADAIQFGPNGTSSLLVSNSLLADNGNHGITVYAKGSGTVSAVFNHVQANNNGGIGIFVWGGDNTGTLPVKVTASNSLTSANGDSGFFASTRTGYAATTLMLFNSVAANNWRGLVANGGATLRVGQSAVTGNQIGWMGVSGGSVLSYGNNYIDGNASNEGPPPSVGLK